jgi:hypothetical protein
MYASKYGGFLKLVSGLARTEVLSGNPRQSSHYSAFHDGHVAGNYEWDPNVKMKDPIGS